MYASGHNIFRKQHNNGLYYIRQVFLHLPTHQFNSKLNYITEPFVYDISLMSLFVVYVGSSLSRTITLTPESSYRYFNPTTRYRNIAAYSISFPFSPWR